MLRSLHFYVKKYRNCILLKLFILVPYITYIFYGYCNLCNLISFVGKRSSQTSHKKIILKE